MKSPAEVVKTACSCFKSSCGANSKVTRSSRFNVLRLLCFLCSVPSLWGCEYRDSVAAIRSYPDLLSDLYGNSAGAKCVTVRMLDDFLHLQRCRIDLHDVGCLHRPGAALSGREDGPVWSPS